MMRVLGGQAADAALQALYGRLTGTLEETPVWGLLPRLLRLLDEGQNSSLEGDGQRQFQLCEGGRHYAASHAARLLAHMRQNHYLVDEFQDTSWMQYVVLRLRVIHRARPRVPSCQPTARCRNNLLLHSRTRSAASGIASSGCCVDRRPARPWPLVGRIRAQALRWWVTSTSASTDGATATRASWSRSFNGTSRTCKCCV